MVQEFISLFKLAGEMVLWLIALFSISYGVLTAASWLAVVTP